LYNNHSIFALVNNQKQKVMKSQMRQQVENILGKDDFLMFSDTNQPGKSWRWRIFVNPTQAQIDAIGKFPHIYKVKEDEKKGGLLVYFDMQPSKIKF